MDRIWFYVDNGFLKKEIIKEFYLHLMCIGSSVGIEPVPLM